MLEFDKLVNSPIFNGNKTIRYSNIHMIERETLNDHISEISLMCLVACKQLETLGIYLNQGKLLERAIIHDLPEVVTLDIPRPIKYSDPSIKEGFDNLERIVAKKIEKELGTENLLAELDFVKDKTREGLTLKVLDLLLVARKIVRELDVKSNLEVIGTLFDLHKYLKELEEYLISHTEEGEFEYEFYKYLTNLLESTIRGVKEAKDRHVWKVNKEYFKNYING